MSVLVANRKPQTTNRKPQTANRKPQTANRKTETTMVRHGASVNVSAECRDEDDDEAMLHQCLESEGVQQQRLAVRQIAEKGRKLKLLRFASLLEGEPVRSKAPLAPWLSRISPRSNGRLNPVSV